MSDALLALRRHLAAISTGGDREGEGGRLHGNDLRQVLSIVRVMGAVTKRGKPLKADLVGKSPRDLLAEAMKFPEIARAVEELGGG